MQKPPQYAAAICIGLTLLSVGLAAPSTASASFTRPFTRQLTETPAGPFHAPRGLAVDAADNLWVSEIGNGEVDHREPPYRLNRFDSAEGENAFLQTLEIEGLQAPAPEGLTPPGNLAIDNSTGSFFTAAGDGLSQHGYQAFVEVFSSTGSFANRFGPFDYAKVAVDNSAGPSAGSVYVSQVGFSGVDVEKFNAAGEAVPFTGCGLECAKYVSANQITGDPVEAFGTINRIWNIAVDSHGDIYVSRSRETSPFKVIDEYEPSGRFVREFTGEQSPGLGESHEGGGFGGVPVAIAVDPVSGDLLVGVQREGLAAVDEFSPSGQYLNQITKTTAGNSLHGASSLATDSRGDLYVLNRREFEGATGEPAIDVYGPGHFLPSLQIAEATQRKPDSAFLPGSLDPEGLPLSVCSFEYVTEAAYRENLANTEDGFSDLSSGGSAPCTPKPAEIPADSKFHPVQAELTGLLSGTTYRYRLSATASGELGGTASSEALAFTAPHRPRVESTSVDNLSSTFADLRASVNPLGADTTYQFQYLTAAEYLANGDSFAGEHVPSAVPVPAASIGSGGETGSSPEVVLQHLAGLAPSTAYRFRVLASNEIGATEGEEAEGGGEVAHTFSTLPAVSPGLADNRAYEMLTPSDKEGAADMFAPQDLANNEFENKNNTGYPSESGNQFVFETRADFGPFPGSGVSAYVFSRTPTGWAHVSLASPSLGVQAVHAPVFDSADLSRVGIDDLTGSAAASAGVSQTNLTGVPGGPYTTLHADSANHIGEAGEETHLVGASRNLDRLVLETRNHSLAGKLAEAQVEGSHALYEYSQGNFQLLNLASNGKLLNPCGAMIGPGGETNGSGRALRAVSGDGSRVIFTAPDPYMSTALGGPGGAGCWNGAGANTPQLYQRSGSATVEVSAPEPGVTDPSGRHPALYVGATADGARVFFLTSGELTPDDAGIHDPELYEWRAEGTGGCAQAKGCRTRISSGESGHAAANVYGVPAVSADGSAVYFLAFGALAPGASPLEESENPVGLDAAVNLYRYDTASGATSFVAAVGARDYNFTGSSCWCSEGPAGFDVVPGSNSPNWYATPDGRYLLFSTTRALTGYDTKEQKGAPTCFILSKFDGRCQELYRFDASGTSDGRLLCVSCNPSGARPVSNAAFASRSPSGYPAAAATIRPISNDGSYAFFDSADPLVPQDTNGTLDVYEWHDGSISLISSGHDAAPSFFLGATPDGSNVFFGTHARLVAADTDIAGDLYDARICIAADPCIAPPPSREGLCEGDACSHPPAPPGEPTLATSVPGGAGNPRPGTKLRCTRGRSLRHGRCVMRRHARAPHAGPKRATENKPGSNR
jgi:hypothetical protein